MLSLGSLSEGRTRFRKHVICQVRHLQYGIENIAILLLICTVSLFVTFRTFTLGLIFHVLQHQFENECFFFSSRILTRGVIGKHERMTAPQSQRGTGNPALCSHMQMEGVGLNEPWGSGLGQTPVCVHVCLVMWAGGVWCRNGESVGVAWLRFL